MSVEEARSLVVQAHEAMTVANAAILANPAANVHSHQNTSDIREAVAPAPPLNYQSPSATLARRQLSDPALSNSTFSNNARSRNTYSYTIPTELAQAAAVLAEEAPPTINMADYARGRRMQQDLAPRRNNTNAMRQKIRRPDGLNQAVVDDETEANQFRLADPEPSASSLPDSGSIASGTKFRREDDRVPPYWIGNHERMESSPFAPPGYEVFRNIKDYGAYGDGIHDDTAAIQAAISDGGRCGAGCSGSTILPATVYFPRGVYLVSSSIIQYYNTEFIGDPLDMPVILAAPSFVGLGVFSSNVYTGGDSQWYLNTANFLRSIRNFIIDVRHTPQDAYVCAIHWQVSQATSLENIHFYMTDIDDDPTTTQQGIYMENGSGGFLGELYFFGGKFGAYLGNQQFTATGLYFDGSETAVQIHWDFGWTLQGLVVQNCGTGLNVVNSAGGASGPQGVGSLVLSDTRMMNTAVGVASALSGSASTALMIKNSRFTNVASVVRNVAGATDLLTGGSGDTDVASWGIGDVSSPAGSVGFVNGQDIVVMAKPSPLVDGSAVGLPAAPFFTRRRPIYSDFSQTMLIDVRDYGARGDGTTDDAVQLNYILDMAANISAVVYFPFGVYLVKDTVHVPVGSRILGQAWPQIMATGARFQDQNNPVPVIKVGNRGDKGVIEIQSMMVTVRGPTAGAILMEWNVHESVQGSAAMWDTHFRVGGAHGTDLRAADCPKLSNQVNPGCIAASLMVHLTTFSSAYLENIWMWTADHDMDTANKDLVDIYSGRGILIESRGPTWLWGTSSEHNVLYQYQVSGAKDLLLGLVQTESPYYQPVPKAPHPFTAGIFTDDPVFGNCASNPTECMAWAIRILESSFVYILNTGLYNFFNNHDRTCSLSGNNNCQRRAFSVEESADIWIYNLVTIGTVEMISPLNGPPLLAASRLNGAASTLLAWLGGAGQEVGTRPVTGYRLYTAEDLLGSDFTESCRTALSAIIMCRDYTKTFTASKYYGTPLSDYPDGLCTDECRTSLENWNAGVQRHCKNQGSDDGLPPHHYGAAISYGLTETCLKSATGEYCNDVIDGFLGDDDGDTVEGMSVAELCNECFILKLQTMQGSSYSAMSWSNYYQNLWTRAVEVCNIAGASTEAPESVLPEEDTGPAFCLSGEYYTTVPGDTCDTIALAYGVPSAGIILGNTGLFSAMNCSHLTPGSELCLPSGCSIYQVDPEDDCMTIHMLTDVYDFELVNTWLLPDCSNLQDSVLTLGSVICLTPPGGLFDDEPPPEDTSGLPDTDSLWTTEKAPLPAGAVLAPGTSLDCGGWSEAEEAEGGCTAFITRNGMSLDDLLNLNGGLGEDFASCTAALTVGTTYCVKYYTPKPPAPTITKLGCWRNLDDGFYPLPHKFYTDIDESDMTVYGCARACGMESYRYSGILAGKTCFCGAEIDINSEELASSQCNTPCAGRPTEQCGGETDELTIYGTTDALKFTWGRLGCFPSPRDGPPALPGTPGTLAGPHSALACAASCMPQNAFFGLKGGDQCICSDVFDVETVPVSDALCDSPCDFGATCGGEEFMEVYGMRMKRPERMTYAPVPTSIYLTVTDESSPTQSAGT